jgi:hypothetical protein
MDMVVLGAGVKNDRLCAGPKQRYLLAMKFTGTQILTAFRAAPKSGQDRIVWLSDGLHIVFA